jgi:chromosome segregation and condensation protein ScpB
MLYGTTPDFLRCFGLSSLTDLPGVTPEEAADLFDRMQRTAMQPELDENQISFEEVAAASGTPGDTDTAE